jgi:hypothetical protein
MTPPSKNKSPEKPCVCGTTNWFRTPRPQVVKILLGWLPLKYYKCYMCDRKKWILG